MNNLKFPFVIIYLPVKDLFKAKIQNILIALTQVFFLTWPPLPESCISQNQNGIILWYFDNRRLRGSVGLLLSYRVITFSSLMWSPIRQSCISRNRNGSKVIVGIGVSIPPHPPPPKSTNCLSPSFLGNPPYILAFQDPPPPHL